MNSKTSAKMRPSDEAVLERASSLANEAIHIVALQRRRLRSSEPEDDSFVFRYWADLQFFIISLRRLRRTAELANKVQAVSSPLSAALKKFDDSVPALKIMRNVGEHIDDYALDDPKRHHKNINRQSLQVGTWDGTTFEWLDAKLNIDEAHDAAIDLYQAVQKAAKSYPSMESKLDSSQA